MGPHSALIVAFKREAYRQVIQQSVPYLAAIDTLTDKTLKLVKSAVYRALELRGCRSGEGHVAAINCWCARAISLWIEAKLEPEPSARVPKREW